MHHISGIADTGEDRGGFGALEVVQRRLGNERFQRRPVAGLQTLADGRGTDGLAVCFPARDHDAVNAGFRELLAHDLVVKAGHLTGRLFADVPGGDVQGGGDLGEHRQIQPCVTVDDRRFVFQEVAGEGRIGNDVGAAVVEHNILYVNGAFRDISHPVGRLMHDFNCTNAADMFSELLAAEVRYLKEDERGRTSMCKLLEEMRDEAAEKATYAKAIETARSMLADGFLTYEKIAQYSGLSLDEIKELAGQRSA